MEVLILWLAIGAGCMAIWPVTIPNPEYSRRVVTVLALLMETRSNPGVQAQDVVVVGK